MNRRPKKLLDQVRDAIRVKHYPIRTEEAYIGWIRRYILFHDKRHPREMAAPEIAAFLTHLAVDQNVAASTQNQALSALLFLCRAVLEMQSISLTPSNASTPTPTKSGAGSTSSPPGTSRETPAPALYAAITSARPARKEPSEKRLNWQASTNPSVVTPSATPSPPFG